MAVQVYKASTADVGDDRGCGDAGSCDERGDLAVLVRERRAEKQPFTGRPEERGPLGAVRRGKAPAASGRLPLLAVGAIEGLAALSHLDELLAGLELRPVFRRQLMSAGDESLEPHAVDERQRAA